MEQYLIHEVVTQKYSHLGRIHGIPPELKELAYEESKKKRRDNQDEPNGEEAEVLKIMLDTFILLSSKSSSHFYRALPPTKTISSITTMLTTIGRSAILREELIKASAEGKT